MPNPFSFQLRGHPEFQETSEQLGGSAIPVTLKGVSSLAHVSGERVECVVFIVQR